MSDSKPAYQTTTPAPRTPNYLDPERTLAAPSDYAAIFSAIKVFALAAKIQSPELGGRHAAARFYHATGKRDGRMAISDTRAAAKNTGGRVHQRCFAPGLRADAVRLRQRAR